MGKNSRADRLLAVALRQRAEVLLSLERPAREQEDDAVHQFRVACSRIRALLRVYKDAFTVDPANQLEDELHWLTGFLGAERDTEVMSGRLHETYECLPPEITKERTAATLLEEQSAMQFDAHRELVRALDSERYRVLVAMLQRFVERPSFAGGKRGKKWCWRQIEAAMAKTRRRVEALPPSGQERETGLHSVRKAAKRVRYGAEILIGEGNRRANDVTRLFHGVQRLLGDVHDANELCRYFETMHAEPGLLLGYLYCLEHERARNSEAAFLEIWKKAKRL